MKTLDLSNERNYQYIDPDIRLLIHELNRVGLKTVFSCSGNHGKESSEDAYIGFDVRKIKSLEFASWDGKLFIRWQR